MQVHVSGTKVEMGARAAREGAARIREALAQRDRANLVVATGASQFEMLDALVREPDLDWSRVTGFHLDEYVGLPITHRASFRAYVWERFVRKLPFPPRAFHFLDAEHDPQAECERVGSILRTCPIDVAFLGIGENGHIAFNDPPADFVSEEPYLVVELDEACRRQQLGEGWFATLNDVPRQAVSMSVRQILKSSTIVCTVPDERKAVAVLRALQGEVTPMLPASILQQHGDCRVFLDQAAASLLA
jgi:glucosamine-6-phosphate deaminase